MKEYKRKDFIVDVLLLMTHDMNSLQPTAVTIMTCFSWPTDNCIFFKPCGSCTHTVDLIGENKRKTYTLNKSVYK